MPSLNMTVEGMHCNSCVVLVKEELEDLGAEEIKITLKDENGKPIGVVECFINIKKETIVNTINSLGYRVRE